MIHAVSLKVCGITRAVDAVVAAELGADFLGFIFYPKSPRHVTMSGYEALRPGLPAAPAAPGTTAAPGAPGVPGRVAVMVEPGLADLSAALRAGFDFFQIHFNPDVPRALVMEWSKLVGRERLWLAPRLPVGAEVSPLLCAVLPLADTFLVDTFDAGSFGGSGRTGDWQKFARLREAFPSKTWFLAGGLNPQNVAGAIARSGAQCVDVNSGVEDSPGVKSHVRLRALAAALGGLPG